MVVRKLLAGAAAAIAICALMPAGAPADTDILAGTWTLVAASADRANLTLARHSAGSTWEWSSTVRLADLQGLARGALQEPRAPLHFALRKPAGRFECIGTTSKGTAAGTFTFMADSEYANALAARGIEHPQPSEQLELAMTGVTPAYIDELRGAGLRPMLDDLLRFHNEGVDTAYVLDIARAMAGVSTDDIFRLRNHGVQPEFLAALHAAGLTPSVDEAVALADHALTARYVGELRRLGYAPDSRELIRIADHRVTAGWIKQVLATGVRPSVDDLIRMRDAGV